MLQPHLSFCVVWTQAEMTCPKTDSLTEIYIGDKDRCPGDMVNTKERTLSARSGEQCGAILETNMESNVGEEEECRLETMHPH